MAKKKILLHSCCAPCSTAVIERLNEEFDITILYYNPNIYPEEEYLKRKNEEIRYIEILKEKGIDISMLDCDYESEKFYNAAKGLENEREGGARCAVCFKLRLEETAKKAKELDFDIFGTTLTVSPHKNAEVINAIGLSLSQKHDIPYLESNFKKQDGYKRSVELSKENGIYRQAYCGCEFALKIQERECPESLKKVY
jgi:predicted adenine nucleotide alpha hydrolase (AANH) superfamily ATPase